MTGGSRSHRRQGTGLGQMTNESDAETVAQGQRDIVEQNQTTIASVIDRIPPAYLIRIVGVCFLIVLMDGFDTQAIGFAATAISSSLAIPITAFGQVFSAGLFGARRGAL